MKQRLNGWICLVFFFSLFSHLFIVFQYTNTVFCGKRSTLRSLAPTERAWMLRMRPPVTGSVCTSVAWPHATWGGGGDAKESSAVTRGCKAGRRTSSGERRSEADTPLPWRARAVWFVSCTEPFHFTRQNTRVAWQASCWRVRLIKCSPCVLEHLNPTSCRGEGKNVSLTARILQSNGLKISPALPVFFSSGKRFSCGFYNWNQRRSPNFVGAARESSKLEKPEDDLEKKKKNKSALCFFHVTLKDSLLLKVREEVCVWSGGSR